MLKILILLQYTKYLVLTIVNRINQLIIKKKKHLPFSVLRDTGVSGLYLIQLDYVRHVVPLLQLLLSLQQRVHAVVAAADLLVVLLLQHGGDTAQAAQAAPPGAHPTGPAYWRRGLRLTRAARDAEGLPRATGELICRERDR